MTDLGFGLVDRRSILVVLFVLGISHLFLGNQVPIDTSDAFTAFLSLLILTGFIYATRSILRILVTACFAVLRIPYDIVIGFKERKRSERGLRGIIIISTKSILGSFLLGFVYPAFYRRDWKFQYQYNGYSVTSRKYGLLGAIDRMLLVGIAYAATVPNLSNQVQTFGFLGVILLILVYIIGGTFTLVLDDAIHKGDTERERQHAEVVAAAKNPNISFPRTIYTKEEPKFYGP